MLYYNRHTYDGKPEILDINNNIETDNIETGNTETGNTETNNIETDDKNTDGILYYDYYDYYELDELDYETLVIKEEYGVDTYIEHLNQLYIFFEKLKNIRQIGSINTGLDNGYGLLYINEKNTKIIAVNSCDDPFINFYVANNINETINYFKLHTENCKLDIDYKNNNPGFIDLLVSNEFPIFDKKYKIMNDNIVDKLNNKWLSLYKKKENYNKCYSIYEILSEPEMLNIVNKLL